MTKEDIIQLIEKYDDGLTTNAEEKALRQFFAEQPQDGLPDEWRVYKALFAFADESIVEKEHALPSDEMAENVINSKERSIKATVIRLVALSVAACAAIAIIITATLTTNNDSSKDYAVIDGIMVTDKQQVTAEAEAALLNVAYGDDDTFGALDDI